MTSRTTLSLILFSILLAMLQIKTRLWSGNNPDLLFVLLINYAGYVGIIELLFISFIAFLFLTGPIIIEETIVLMIVIAFIHFLKSFVFGQSPFLSPIFSFLGISSFYILTTGAAFFSSPLFIFEIFIISLLLSAIIQFFLLY